MVERAEIFRVVTLVITRSAIKSSNLYLSVTKTYEPFKLSKRLIFAYIQKFTKFERLNVGSWKF